MTSCRTAKSPPKAAFPKVKKEKTPRGIFPLIPIAGIPFPSAICTADLAADCLDSFNHLDSKNTNTEETRHKCQLSFTSSFANTSGLQDRRHFDGIQRVCLSITRALLGALRKHTRTDPKRGTAPSSSPLIPLPKSPLVLVPLQTHCQVDGPCGEQPESWARMGAPVCLEAPRPGMQVALPGRARIPRGHHAHTCGRCAGPYGKSVGLGDRVAATD